MEFADPARARAGADRRDAFEWGAPGVEAETSARTAPVRRGEDATPGHSERAGHGGTARAGCGGSWPRAHAAWARGHEHRDFAPHPTGRPPGGACAREIRESAIGPTA